MISTGAIACSHNLISRINIVVGLTGATKISHQGFTDDVSGSSSELTGGFQVGSINDGQSNTVTSFKLGDGTDVSTDTTDSASVNGVGTRITDTFNSDGISAVHQCRLIFMVKGGNVPSTVDEAHYFNRVHHRNLTGISQGRTPSDGFTNDNFLDFSSFTPQTTLSASGNELKQFINFGSNAWQWLSSSDTVELTFRRD